MNKDVVLFDLDGTLIDPKEGITKSIKYALGHFGITVSDEQTLCRFIGPPLKSGFMEFYNFDEKKAQEAQIKYRERYSVAGILENKLYPGIAELLEKLKMQDKTLFLATSKPAVYAEKILKHFQIDSFFSFVSGSELSGARSEKEEVIKYVFEKNQFAEKSRAIMIGDRKHDIIGAKLNSIDCIGVLYGYGNYEELSLHNPDFLVKSVNELTCILCGR